MRTRWAHNPRSVGNLVVWCIWIYHCHKLHHRIWWSSASWLESENQEASNKRIWKLKNYHFSINYFKLRIPSLANNYIQDSALSDCCYLFCILCVAKMLGLHTHVHYKDWLANTTLKTLILWLSWIGFSLRFGCPVVIFSHLSITYKNAVNAQNKRRGQSACSLSHYLHIHKSFTHICQLHETKCNTTIKTPKNLILAYETNCNMLIKTL